MNKREKAKKVLDILGRVFSDARIALNFSNPLELLISTILSARCTDERVNIVTDTLFKKYGSAGDYARVDLEELASDIKSINFFNNKARSIQKCAVQLIEDFSGRVPSTLIELVTLAGVGRKTANVVLGNAFNVPALAVDTHVLRVAGRIGLAHEKDPDKVEAELTAVIPQERWTVATRLLILHGRTICKARKPLCESCPVSALCDWFKGQT